MQLLLSEAMIVVPSCIYLFMKKYNFRDVFRLRRVDKKLVIASVLLALAVVAIADEVDRLIGMFIEMPPEFEQVLLKILKADTFTDWVMLILAAVILAGIVEEMLFRGMLLQSLERRLELPYAIFLTALVFAMFHPTPWLLQVLLFGLLLGYLAWRSKSIVPGIILHCMTNAFSIISLNTDFAWFKWYDWYDHVYPPVLVVAACVAYYSMKWFHHLTE